MTELVLRVDVKLHSHPALFHFVGVNYLMLIEILECLIWKFTPKHPRYGKSYIFVLGSINLKYRGVAGLVYNLWNLKEVIRPGSCQSINNTLKGFHSSDGQAAYVSNIGSPSFTT